MTHVARQRAHEEEQATGRSKGRPFARRSTFVPSVTLTRWSILATVAGFSFLLRLVLAGKESYWIDELFSVEQYVLHHDTVGQAIVHLAQTSVHPPLYQFLLYFWVELFGSTEAATRTLSNLFVTAAIVVLHRLVERFHGRTLANAVAFACAFSYTATFFGIETRSYALTLLLAVASSYTLFRYLDALRTAKGLVGRMFPGPWAGAFLATNVALLMTHYYNVFYWGAQAMFAVALILFRDPDHRRWQLLPGLVSAYILQIGVFLLGWYSIATASIRTMAPEFQTDTPEQSPLAIIASLTKRNLFLGPVPGIVAVLFVLGVVGASLVQRRSTTADDDLDRSGMAYTLWMIVAPAALAWGAFLAIGAERFAARYYVYLVPHLIVAFVLAGRLVVRGLRALPRAIRPSGSWLATPARSLPAGLLLLGVLVLPGTIAAAAHSKADWRGAADDVVAIVQSNPDKRFAVYQASFRPQTMLDHYLRRRTNGEILADGFIDHRREELAGRFGFEEDDWRHLEGHDTLIVVFVEPPADWFPVALERLQQRYGDPFSMLDDNGHGLVVFDLAGG